ncbi:MAG: cobalt transporter CbiM [Gallionellaceae bacterium]|nr:cobalt transporter CbiM [Gallionellaceae bacterium]MDD5365574.1 cobalt transporter CbiM [Gallionellaceae bacterium]
MHIPDGYLSPATCLVTYAITLPFWYLALQRVKRLLHTRMVPLLAVFSAFSFVIMMFNLPLPGGTTGHAVGVAVAAIVLGPWAAMVAISIALLIQAVFFGDGGITTFAANSLNMAVVGSLVAYWSYSLIAGKAELASPRRVVAAALAGYLAVNVAALLTAIEFGIQPMLAQDATGAPLYAPYPLEIAIPAMMIGHLTIAGIAELAITGGLVAYLQRANPALLAFSTASGMPKLAAAGAWQSTRKLWYALAGLMIMTPLGLLAAGTAWGEWGAEDFGSAEARQEILAASGHVAPPEAAPQGMERLASLWTAPIPDYAPSFMHSAGYGYILSAVLGAGLILLLFLLVGKFTTRQELPET